MIFGAILIGLLLFIGGVCVLFAFLGFLIGKLVFIGVAGGLFVLGAMLFSGNTTLVVTAVVVILLILGACLRLGMR